MSPWLTPAAAGEALAPLGGTAGAATTLLGAAGLLAAGMLRRPEAAWNDVPAAEFSTERALHHVREIARAPRPLGSAEHRRVREHLVRELTELGLDCEVQRATVVDESDGMRPGTTVRIAADVANVVALLPGAEGASERPAVVLVAHYDTVPASPGANDNAVAVAALLETARALAGERGRLGNDVVFLFTDAEEVGQLGARAFVEQHELRERIGAVLNFEARGSRGPALMFETGRNSQAAYRHLERAADHQYTSSLFQEVYKRMPNATDFSAFKKAGIPGFNFAHIGGYTHYHSASDTPETVEPETLQHHGSYALTLARRLGGADLAALRGAEGEEIVFFTLPTGRLVRYPARWTPPLAVATAVVWLAALALLVRGRGLDLGATALGALLALVPAAAVAAAAQPAGTRLGSRRPEFAYYGHPSRAGGLFLSGIVAANLSGYTLLAWAFGTAGRPLELAVGATVWWLLPMLLTARAAPCLGYLLSWPLLGSAAGLVLIGYGPLPADLAGLGLVTAGPVCLVGPLIVLTYTALSQRLSAVPSLVASLVCMALLAPLGALTAALGWPLPAALAVAAVALAGAGLRPRRGLARYRGVLYALDADRGRAVVAAVERDAVADPDGPGEPDHGPLPEFFGAEDHRFFHVQADPVELAAPTAVVTDAHSSAGRRTLTLSLTSRRGAAEAVLFLDGAHVLHYEVDGCPGTGRGAEDEGWSLWFYGLTAEGRTVTVTVEDGSPLTLRLMDRTDGVLPGALPADGGPPAAALPAPALGSGMLCNSTWVSASTGPA
ncbi:M20/M25/M40 family metallo-hydrolase [Streptomyces albidoflavus]|uniref:M20/M25/M40 family metallo-hydrolase n=1 Tax=Streptomyces koyangensis TaxID=188770 RepID=UPI003D090614|nr:M20/M25/M40 family metallo-hydrolase [Streptomyces albidoflavus]